MAHTFAVYFDGDIDLPETKCNASFFFVGFLTYHKLFRLRLILNCGRENVGGFDVHKINSKNDDAVY